MRTQKKKKKITKPFAIKCPVCNGRGEVKAHLYKDDSFGIDMTYVTCHACKGHGYIIRYGAELIIYYPDLVVKEKKNETIAEISIPTGMDINSCNNCIYACSTLTNNPTQHFCFLKSCDFPTSYICSDWSGKTND